jgi:photosystem II stability/assembly factor-like uncharacterized protein
VDVDHQGKGQPGKDSRMRFSGVVLMGTLLLFHIVPAISQSWIAQPSGLPADQFAAVDANVAWAVNRSQSIYIRTTDGGTTWIPWVVQGGGGLVANGISALDADRAWVVMSDPSNATSGGIFRTTNGGVGWARDTTSFRGTGGFPRYIRFFDSENGLAVGNQRDGYWEIYVTSDGGRIWTRVPSGDIPPPWPDEQITYGSDFTSTGRSFWFSVIVTPTSSSSALYRTSDCGMTWSVTRAVISGANGMGIAFKDSVNGLACTHAHVTGNKLSRTTDAGQTWTPLTAPVVGHSLFHVTAIGNGGEYIVTSASQRGIIYTASPGCSYSTDDGDTWVQLDLSARGKPSFSSETVGWCAGGTDSVYKWVPRSPSGVRDAPIATGFALDQNYPNPFNPSTTIRFGLPNRSQVTLTLFNTLGQQVAVLKEGEQGAGYHEVRFDGKNLPSGVYFYMIQAGEFVATKRLLLLQ